MYLTKIQKGKEDVRTNVYAIHQQIAEAFPQQRRLFYCGASDITVISENPSISGGRTSSLIDTSSFKTGDVKTFTTRINPVKRSKATQKIEIIRDEDLFEFVINRFKSSGFKLASIQIIKEPLFLIKKSQKVIPYKSLRINGTLQITDPVIFKDVLLQGITGKGKAFGFGMLNIF